MSLDYSGSHLDDTPQRIKDLEKQVDTLKKEQRALRKDLIGRLELVHKLESKVKILKEENQEE